MLKEDLELTSSRKLERVHSSQRQTVQDAWELGAVGSWKVKRDKIRFEREDSVNVDCSYYHKRALSYLETQDLHARRDFLKIQNVILISCEVRGGVQSRLLLSRRENRLPPWASLQVFPVSPTSDSLGGLVTGSSLLPASLHLLLRTLEVKPTKATLKALLSFF